MPCRIGKGMLKLDAMENPHRLPPRSAGALGQRLGALALNRYPGERVNDLRARWQIMPKCPKAFDLMLGNGSDELISLLAMACDVPRRRYPGARARLCDVRHERAVAGAQILWRAAHARL
jgi:histidinol-phosphate/aromatic aminotransferase/cobyric acid decarboxylase-like protein